MLRKFLDTMTNIYLKGRLGKEFGKVWRLDVKTPQEAFRAIDVNTQGRFGRYLLDTSRDLGVGYVFMIGDHIIDTKEKVVMFSGPHGKEDLTVTPIVGGAYGFTTIIVEFVVAIVLAVVSAMMAPSPNIDLGSNNDTARKDSYLFSGGPQPTKQGKPVPVGYGRMIVYPMAISVQYEYSSKSFGIEPTSFVDNGSNYNDWGDSGGYYNTDAGAMMWNARQGIIGSADRSFFLKG
jgi:predicted phage tail protein